MQIKRFYIFWLIGLAFAVGTFRGYWPNMHLECAELGFCRLESLPHHEISMRSPWYPQREDFNTTEILTFKRLHLRPWGESEKIMFLPTTLPRLDKGLTEKRMVAFSWGRAYSLSPDLQGQSRVVTSGPYVLYSPEQHLWISADDPRVFLEIVSIRSKN